MNTEVIKKNLFIILSFWLICGLLSFLFLCKPYYDWFNYHHYNAWAYFNNRYDMDFLAANHRSYFIPYADLSLYFFMDKLNNHPFIFLFLESFDNALVLSLAYKICDAIFQVPSKQKFLFNLYNIIFLITSPVFLLLLNFSMNDMKVAVFVLLGFYILIKNIFEQDKPNRLRNIFISGIFIGISLVLKLTSIIYVLTLFIVLLLMIKRFEKPYKTIFMFFSGVVLSFIFFSGHWYYLVYKHFKNPFFPYFNEIFKSEYGPFINLLQVDFAHVKPRNLIEFLFFPFLLSSKHSFGNSEYSFDARYALIFMIILSIIPYLIYIDKSKKNSLFADIISINNAWFLISFISISYFINLYLFGTYRYIISTCVLFGFVVIVFSFMLLKILNLKIRDVIDLLIAILIMAFCFTNLGFNSPFLLRNFKNIHSVINVTDNKFEDDSYVFVTNTLLSYVLPYQNSKAHYIYIPFPANFRYKSKYNKNLYVFRKKDLVFNSKNLYYPYLVNNIKDIMNSDSKVYVIGYWNSSNMSIFGHAINHYSQGKRVFKNCKNMHSKIFNFDRLIMVCEYNKTRK